MATLYATKAGLIDQGELARSIARGELERATEERGVRVSAHSLTPADLEQTRPFTAIGLGKPMSVRMHCIYAGELPGRRKDLLVASGVRSAVTYDAVGRAINIVRDRVADREFVRFSALHDGSPIVYYTPSVTDYSVLASFEMVPDTFPADVFDKIGGLFAMAGGLPIFAPAASYLMAGSFVTRMIKGLGNAFLERGPVLASDLTLNFGLAGLPLFREGFHVLANDSDVSEVEEHTVEVQGSEVFLARNGQPYQGRAPYIILGVDGASEPSLEAFEPHLASAAVLEKFYPSGERFGVAIDELGQALKLHNDLKFRRKAQDLKARLEKLTEGTQEYESMAVLYEAYRKNIQQEEFALPSLQS